MRHRKYVMVLPCRGGFYLFLPHNRGFAIVNYWLHFFTRFSLFIFEAVSPCDNEHLVFWNPKKG